MNTASLTNTLRGLAAAALLACGAGAHAASVETFVMSVGGESRLIPPFGCSTFGAPAPVMQFFGAMPPGVPTEGLATCQVAGTFRHQVAPAGPIGDSTALNTTFNNTQPVPNTFQGDASASASSGRLAATAHAAFTGPSNSFTVEGSNAFGKFNETFTLHSPTHADGTAGLLVFGIQLAGEVRAAETSPFYAWADVELRYQHNGGPIFTAMRASTDGTTPFIATLSEVSNTVGAVVNGFTLAPRSVSGAGEISTLALPFVFGTPFDFTLGLLAAGVPATDGISTSTFEAFISRIAPTVNGQAVTDFSVLAASGTPYGAGGVGAVPEAPAAWLFAAGGLALLARRRYAARSDGVR